MVLFFHRISLERNYKYTENMSTIPCFCQKMAQHDTYTYCQSHLQKLVPPSSGQRLVLTDFTCTYLFKVNKNKSDLIAHIMS